MVVTTENFENNCNTSNGKYYDTNAGNLCCVPSLMKVSYKANPSQQHFYQCANGKAFTIYPDACGSLLQLLSDHGLSQQQLATTINLLEQ